nr:MAG TPA: hypothetical protein [Caudoviricetes sp.]
MIGLPGNLSLLIVMQTILLTLLPRILHFCRLNLQPTFIYISSRLSICFIVCARFLAKTRLC